MDFVYFHVATTDRERADAARFWEAARSRVRAELEADSDVDSDNGSEAAPNSSFDKLMQPHDAVGITCWDEERWASALRALSRAFRAILAVVWAVLLCVRLRRQSRRKKECIV